MLCVFKCTGMHASNIKRQWQTHECRALFIWLENWEFYLLFVVVVLLLFLFLLRNQEWPFAAVYLVTKLTFTTHKVIVFLCNAMEMLPIYIHISKCSMFGMQKEKWKIEH